MTNNALLGRQMLISWCGRYVFFGDTFLLQLMILHCSTLHWWTHNKMSKFIIAGKFRTFAIMLFQVQILQAIMQLQTSCVDAITLSYIEPHVYFVPATLAVIYAYLLVQYM